jgi:hypothetical protein
LLLSLSYFSNTDIFSQPDFYFISFDFADADISVSGITFHGFLLSLIESVYCFQVVLFQFGVKEFKGLQGL